MLFSGHEAWPAKTRHIARFQHFGGARSMACNCRMLCHEYIYPSPVIENYTRPCKLERLTQTLPATPPPPRKNKKAKRTVHLSFLRSLRQSLRTSKVHHALPSCLHDHVYICALISSPSLSCRLPPRRRDFATRHSLAQVLYLVVGWSRERLPHGVGLSQNMGGGTQAPSTPWWFGASVQPISPILSSSVKLLRRLPEISPSSAGESSRLKESLPRSPSTFTEQSP